MNVSTTHFVGWTAVVGGVVGVVSFVSLVLLFVVGEPFGTLNDLLAIPVAILLTPLLVALFRLHAAEQAMLSTVAMLVGLAGFWATAIGGGLLVLGRISFEQSLLPGIGGFGLIGLWVLLNSVMGLAHGRLPSSVAWPGLALGLTPTFALLALFWANRVGYVLTNMANRTTGFQVSPFMMLVFVLGFISYAGLPVWFILMGRLFLASRLGMLSASVVAS